MFDSIISEAQKKFNLGDKAGGLLASLLGLIANPASGGFGGFIGKFKDAGLGDLVNSWVTTGDNTPISGEQLESALGDDTISSVAAQAGVDKATATSALGYMTPHVVDALTPDGEVPDDESLLSKVKGFLGDFGGAIGAAVLGGLGTAGAFASGAADKVGDAAGATLGAGKAVVGKGAEVVGDAAGATVDAGKRAVGAVGDAAGAVGDKFSGAMSSVGDAFDGDGDSGGILKWLIPLLLLGLLIIIGLWTCRKSPEPTAPTNANTNANKGNAITNTTAKAVDSSFSLVAKDGKYTVSGLVKDEATLKQIKDALTAQYGAENVNFDGLKVDANAKPFGTGWWDSFSKLLPSLKDWKTGTLSFVGNAITAAIGLPEAAIGQIKSLFGTGWMLPVSIAGAEGTTKEANQESLKELESATSVEEVIKALNVSIINFNSSSSDVPADATAILEKAAEVLKKQPAGTVIEVGGYTDNQGNAEANKKLSQTRADAVKAKLVKLGVADVMLKAVGYGDANPIGDNATKDGQFKNRRIEYKKSDGTAPTSTTTETKPVNKNTN